MLPKRLHQQPHLLFIGIVWIAVQSICFWRFDIETGLEARKYVEQADFILAGKGYSSLNFLFYSTQILLIAVSKWTGTFPWLPVLIQLGASGLATAAFYRLSVRFTSSALKATLATLALGLMFYYQLYNVSLFTESLFFSFVVLYTYLLFSIQKISLKTAAILLIGLSMLYFTRPTGVFFIPATVLFIIFRFYPRQAFRLILVFTAIGIVLTYLLLNFALGSGGEFDFLLPYLDERIICGVPTISGQNPITIPVEKNSIEGLWYIITHYPELFFRLAWKRFLAFFGLIRPYYSVFHNFFIAAYFYTCYVLIFFKLKRWTRLFRPQTFYMLSLISLYALTTILSCDEWHNRFILTLLPFFLLLAFGPLVSPQEKNSNAQP